MFNLVDFFFFFEVFKLIFNLLDILNIKKKINLI